MEVWPGSVRSRTLKVGVGARLFFVRVPPTFGCQANRSQSALCRHPEIRPPAPALLHRRPRGWARDREARGARRGPQGVLELRIRGAPAKAKVKILHVKYIYIYIHNIYIYIYTTHIYIYIFSFTHRLKAPFFKVG